MIERLRRAVAASVAAFRSLENPSTPLSNPDPWLWEAFGAAPNTSGVAVNERTAMRILPVYACVRIIAETVASLPLITYRRLSKGKERAPDHPVYALLHDRPNPEMSAMTFREQLQAHLLLWGNAFAEIETNKAGAVIGLWPLLPDRTWAERRAGQKVYHTSLPDGTLATLSESQVLHIPGLSFDGLTGYSPIQMAKSALGLTSAAEQFGASFFGRGTTPAGVLKHPKTLTAPAQANLRQQWATVQGGLSNAHRIAILEEGMEWQALGVPPDHAQFLETRKFQLTEIARLYRVPPHMLADLESGASYASVEQMSLDFVTYTLRPWLIRWEQALGYDLLGARERATLFVEHLVDGLLRGDLKSRYDAYAVGRQWGWLSADDVREVENMNPLPDGQGATYMSPLNFVPADQFGKTPPATAKGANAPAADPGASTPTTNQRDAIIAVLRDVGDRMVRREAPQLRKIAKQGEAGWSQGVEGLYREQIDTLARSIQPVFEALLCFGPEEFRSLSVAGRALVREVAERELTIARREIDEHGFAGADALLATWEAQRGEAFAERTADALLSLIPTTLRRVA